MQDRALATCLRQRRIHNRLTLRTHCHRSAFSDRRGQPVKVVKGSTALGQDLPLGVAQIELRHRFTPETSPSST
jgi:hypothetical protein